MGSVVRLTDVAKYIGEKVLFDAVNLEIGEGEKIALVGINGAGKTSLLRLIAGEDSPDEGSVTPSRGVRMAYLTQNPELPEEGTILDALYRIENLSVKKILHYEQAVTSGDAGSIARATSEMDRLQLWDFESRIKQILSQLGIQDFSRSVNALSGGQQKRVALAGALLDEPDFLILDEPTNHLDVQVIEWLESYLQRSSITLLMVTHDRFFLDRVCSTILEIDQQKVHRYTGNYSRFVVLREKRIELEMLEAEKARNLLRKEEEWMRRMPKARSTKSRFRIDSYYSLREKAMQRRDNKQINMNVQETRLGSKILVAKDLSFAWNKVYYLREFSYTFSRFEKIGVIGSNGTGKSTFLDILTGKLNPEKGSLETGETLRIGYYRQDGMDFNENMKVLDAATSIAETVRVGDGESITASQFLNYFLFPPQRQHDLIARLSGGERRRLYLCQVLMKNPNFLILDEPTNDLDIASLQVLEDYLSAFSGCVMVVSHDRYFMDSVVDHLFVFRGPGDIKDFPGNYTYYYEWRIQQESTDIKDQKKPEKTSESRSRRTGVKLSYNEKRELAMLEEEIESLEAEKASLESELTSAGLSADALHEKSVRIGELISILEKKSDRWLELSEMEDQQT